MRGGSGAEEARSGWRRLAGALQAGDRAERKQPTGWERAQAKALGWAPRGFPLTASAEASGLASLPHPWASMGKKERELLFNEPLCVPDTEGPESLVGEEVACGIRGLVQNPHSTATSSESGEHGLSSLCFPICIMGMTIMLSPRAVWRLKEEFLERAQCTAGTHRPLSSTLSAQPCHVGATNIRSQGSTPSHSDSISLGRGQGICISAHIPHLILRQVA